MAKRHARRARQAAASRSASATERAVRRRKHKEGERRARERARRRAHAVSRLRRGVIYAVVVALVGGVAFLLLRSASPKPIPDTTLAAGEAAGCGEIESPASDASGGSHLSSGQTYDYDHEPATAGPHDPSPLPPEPHVCMSPVPETNAVHNLEHGYVLIYYRADGPPALDQDVARSLAAVAEAEFKVIMAPYPALPGDTAFALVAWNKLWACPNGADPDQARTIAQGFVDSFRGSGNAPEPSAP